MRDSTDPLLSSLRMLEKRTFGNFSMREGEKLDSEQKRSLEQAFQAAQKFAENPHGWLVLLGKYGTGKTYLAAAIGNYRVRLNEDVMFVVVPDLLDHLRATFSPSSNISYDELFNQVKNTSLLILDDLGTQSATPWAREKLYQIINYRYNAELPTVITTSMALEEIDLRLQSRLLDTRLCTIYGIITPPFRGVGVPEKPRNSRKVRY
jgi:DNA replication protein DnaC